jgi:hypothetical protein
MRIFYLCVLLLANGCAALAQTLPEVRFEFNDPTRTPAHWALRFHPDGSGDFHAERGSAPAGERVLVGGDLARDLQLNPAFAATVFTVARRHHLFQQKCDSGRKLAFTGEKKLIYRGPEGEGSCAYNYSDDKEIQQLGDTLQAVAETLLASARIELLIQHDRLGVDAELEALANAVADGRARQLVVIRPLLERISQDEELMERVRRRARSLLARVDANPAQ